MGQIWPTTYIWLKKKLLEQISHPDLFMYCLCLFSRYNGRAVAVGVEIVWPAKTKAFTICPFMGKVCQPLTYILKAVRPTDYLELKATV